MGHTSGRFKRFVEKDENRFTARDAKQLDFGSEGTSITNVRQEYDRWKILEKGLQQRGDDT